MPLLLTLYVWFNQILFINLNGCIRLVGNANARYWRVRYISHLAAEIMLTNTINTPIIVIGMHRSGTTLVAEALNKSGIFMGVFREHNGEALHFLSLNQQILAAAGADWINPSTPKNDQDLPFTANQLYAEHIKAVSQNPWRLRACHAMRWGWTR